MALPPKGYPQIRGRRCGEDWTAATEVTGHLPGTGFGNNYRHTIEPIEQSVAFVLSTGDDRVGQLQLQAAIGAKVGELRSLVASANDFNTKEREQVRWLLDRAEAYVQRADDLWTKWETRDGGVWSLTQGDDLGDFYGGICSAADRGRWITRSVPRGTIQVFCPAPYEFGAGGQHAKDRKAIGRLFNDALAHVYCAEYGYWRLRLYKNAFDAYAEPFGFAPGGEPKEPKPTPGIVGPGGLTIPTDTIDPCKDFGINCPPDIGPPEDCPTGWCVDPDELPDPEVLPPEEGGPGEGGLGEGGPVVGSGPTTPGKVDAERRKKTATTVLLAGAGTLLLTGVVYLAIRA